MEVTCVATIDTSFELAAIAALISPRTESCDVLIIDAICDIIVANWSNFAMESARCAAFSACCAALMDNIRSFVLVVADADAD